MISSESADLAKFKEQLEDQAFHNIYPPPFGWSTHSKCKRARNPRDEDAMKTTFKGKLLSTIDENVINSPDGRRRIHTTDHWPYCVHGVIAGKFEDETFRGTGIMIGPNIVLTAGHNLYNYEKKVYADLESLRFEPARNRKLLPFGEVQIENYFVPDDYVNEKKEDYGILILKEPIGEVTGYFGLSWLEPAELIKKKVNITGYPKDKVEKKELKSETFVLWGMDGLIDEIDEEQGLISYKIDTSEGQSGSGLVYEEDGKYFVCGVHIKGSEDVNIATLLTRSRYEQIYKWITGYMREKLHLYLRHSESLEFWSMKINKESLSLLLKENLGNLAFLSFSDCRISKHEVILLAQNTSWINLSQLYLSGNKIGDEGAKGLAQNISWINLSQLDLSENMIGDEGAKGLAQNTSWVNLSQLDLSGNMIGDEGAKGLAQNTSWISLSQLNLSGNMIGDEGAKGFAQNTSWINLSELDLSNKIGFGHLRIFGRKTLTQIDFPKANILRNKISDEGVNSLAKNSSWMKLSILNLSFNEIGNKGAQSLAQNTSWKNLTQLDLSGNQIGNQGAEALAKIQIPVKLAWNHTSRTFSKNTSILQAFQRDDLTLGFATSERAISETSSLYISSVWNTIKDSDAFEDLRIIFSSYYRSFFLKILPPKEFESFVIKISHVVHSKFDLNNSLALTSEEENDESTEELFINTTSYWSTFFPTRSSRQEVSVSAQNDSDFNFNNSNKSNSEEVQPFPKNSYLNSS